ncbi:sigma-70 family RNA polymerase sigma factor [Xanthobacter sp. 126]|uniref:sigma-70 family RNA polymerase sigma factor n=1 Tax=Xanthobacter sp. 126 TaxID=1131814 RepID=UPI0004B82698|nr:sigma-70 family RNA polymerase sigma factor [Xanthobacter sp. 126]
MLFAVAAASLEGAARTEEARPGRRLTATEAAHFRASMLPHLDAAYTLARYLTRDADAAQDIVQDAYLRAYRAFADFKGGSARAWLLAIVRNCHLTWRDLRRREMQRRAPDAVAAEDGGDADDALDLLVDGETPETILLRRSQADRVRGTLELLPEPLREVLVLRELDELSYREIAEVAGVPVGTVMSRLSRARRHFADLWERVAAGPEAVR